MAELTTQELENLTARLLADKEQREKEEAERHAANLSELKASGLHAVWYLIDNQIAVANDQARERQPGWTKANQRIARLIVGKNALAIAVQAFLGIAAHEVYDLMAEAVDGLEWKEAYRIALDHHWQDLYSW